MPILQIFPEGCTTNGTKLIKFKKGAFVSLRPVRLASLKYRSSPWAISHSSCGVSLVGHVYLCLFPWYFSPTIDVLPVFSPNDYFWKHHWQEGKEEKWEAFARVCREILSEDLQLETSEFTMEDKLNWTK